jgi:predicted transcriptional regulator with HTH domain
MQNEEEVVSRLELNRPIAIRALRRSNVRKKIAEYLFEISPNYSYTAEIAYHIQTTPSNVIGAIRGMEVDGHRFIEEAVERGAEVIVFPSSENFDGG